jgi:hypothetical protein
MTDLNVLVHAGIVISDLRAHASVENEEDNCGDDEE